MTALTGYVKQGKVNASLPEGKTADDISLEEAVELLSAKAASKKGSSRKASSAAKKPAGRKPAAKKEAEAQPKTRKLPGTTKSGKPRAGAVRVIRPADS